MRKRWAVKWRCHVARMLKVQTFETERAARAFAARKANARVVLL